MGDESLSPAQRAEYTFLRQQVDRLQDEQYRADARSSVKNELHIATRELKDFTSNLRMQGKNI